MALLCCFLLIVEKIPIVECERLYELTWSSAQSEGSKWPLDLQGLAQAGPPEPRVLPGLLGVLPGPGKKVTRLSSF